MLADRQAAFAKQCAEASSICGDWRKISACRIPEIGELRQKSAVQIPDTPLAPRSSPTLRPGETGLEHLGSVPARAPQGCLPSTGSSSLPRQRTLPRDVTSPAVTRHAKGQSEPPRQDGNCISADQRCAYPRAIHPRHHQLLPSSPPGHCGSTTGGAGRRTALHLHLQPSPWVTTADLTGNCPLDHQFGPVDPTTYSTAHMLFWGRTAPLPCLRGSWASCAEIQSAL